MTTVITYGTFDLFHIGHVRLLQRLNALGSRLVVACSTDEFNLEKGKASIFRYEDRAEILSSCRFVDKVIPECSWDQKPADIRTHKADIFAMGDDWAGKFDYLTQETGCTVTYLARTPEISTTDVKQVLQNFEQERLSGIRNTLDHLREQISAL